MTAFDDIDSKSTALVPVETRIDRISDAETRLRRMPVAGHPIGTSDANDYDEMRTLFVELAETMRAIRSDPNALKSPMGGYDVAMVRALTAMVDSLRKIIEGLNKMKNSDRLTLAILESHTRAMSQNLAIPLGEKIRVALSQIEEGDPNAAQATLTALVQGDIVDIFREAATQAMISSRESYNLQ